MQNIPWPADFFDGVLDVGCLHCLTDQTQLRTAVNEIARVLVPGGQLYSRVFGSFSQSKLEKVPFKTVALGHSTQTLVETFSTHFDLSYFTKGDCTYLRGSMLMAGEGIN